MAEFIRTCWEIGGSAVLAARRSRIHLVSIPVTNTSVNPARSTGPALIVGGWALRQLWLFWVAPLSGAGLAGVAYRFVERDMTGVRQDAARTPRC